MFQSLFYLASLTIKQNQQTKKAFLVGSWIKSKPDGTPIGEMTEEIEPQMAPYLAMQFGQLLPYEQLAHVAAINPIEDAPAIPGVDLEALETEVPIEEITVPASTLKSMKPASKAKR